MEWGGESRLNFYCHPPMTFHGFPVLLGFSLQKERPLRFLIGWMVAVGSSAVC